MPSDLVGERQGAAADDQRQELLAKLAVLSTGTGNL
jgi:hypothetical protein